MVGWGSGGWGSSPWGLGSGPISLLRAQAVRENAVRLVFSEAVLFDRTLVAYDGANPKRYSVMAVPGTFGLDGEEARAVLVAQPELVQEAGAGGRLIDVVLDRAMSPYPAQYLIAVNGLRSTDGVPLSTTTTSFLLFGLQVGFVPRLPDRIVGSRDIANPQSRRALLGLPDDSAPSDVMLGTIRYDATGDVAADEGLVSYRKRVFRRLTSGLGRFAHLQRYGIGVAASVKQLGRPGSRQALAVEAEQQIRLEPETVTVSVVVLLRSDGQAIYRINATTKLGRVNNFEFPVLAA